MPLPQLPQNRAPPLLATGTPGPPPFPVLAPAMFAEATGIYVVSFNQFGICFLLFSYLSGIIRRRRGHEIAIAAVEPGLRLIEIILRRNSVIHRRIPERTTNFNDENY
jgi:hypothetical protein